MFKLKKKSNYDLLYWTLFIACAFTLTFKIIEVVSIRSMEIYAIHPELARYSMFVHMFG